MYKILIAIYILKSYPVSAYIRSFRHDRYHNDTKNHRELKKQGHPAKKVCFANEQSVADTWLFIGEG